MQRVCFLLRVRPERREEYLERHREVWPEMLDALRQAGWRNYTLFMGDDGRVVGYVETEDFAASLQAMAETEVNRRWQESMAPYFDLEGRRPDEGFLVLHEYFHLD